MKNIKSHFKFTKEQRSGIFLLVLVIVLLQAGYYCVIQGCNNEMQPINDQLVQQYNKEVDSVQLENARKTREMKPFNPNYISDYKGYLLGMSVAEIDRLHAFRAKGSFVNSATEFQRVTKVPDSVLMIIAPYFKFPDWVKRDIKKKSKVKVLDMNKASAKDIVRVIDGNWQLANRIVKFRKRLGGFLEMSQLDDVYGMSPKTRDLLCRHFRLKSIPEIKKINLNLADLSELTSIVYINDSLAIEIIEERLLRDGFQNLDELKYVEGFPIGKLKHIKLYLTIN